MKSQIEKLYAIAQKTERRIIGLMSGTSLDGLDVALCVFTGAGAEAKARVERFATLPYSTGFKEAILRVFARREIDFQHLTLLNAEVAETHARLINQCLDDWGVAPEEVDLIASHGQTVFHAPRVFHRMAGRPDATLQIGDGDHIARRTGIITLSDFRQKHIAAGGEGAPLALYGDYYLFSQPGEERFLLNIGGIANFTYLPANGEVEKAVATDTGPGNTLIDQLSRYYFDLPFDEDARAASAGTVNEALLRRMKTDPFFPLPFPKTTGPETFSTQWFLEHAQSIGNISPVDALATATRLTAETVAEAILRIPVGTGKKTLYLSGGGAHNPLIVSHLRALLPEWQMAPMSALGIDGDAKEAVLFAALANETVAGNIVPQTILGGVALVSMGKISLPG